MDKYLKSFAIGDVAKACNITIETIRYYEQEGYIAKSSRNLKGHRIFSLEDIEEIKLISNAKHVGISLSDAKQFLLLKNQERATCKNVKELLDVKIDELNEKIKIIQSMKDTLNDISELCCGGHDSAKDCSIIKSLKKL